MIDMVFLLLVFFMTVSTLAKDARPEMELAESDQAKVPSEAPVREIITVFHQGGDDLSYYVGHRPLPLLALTDWLEEQLQTGAVASLVLRGDPDLPWSAWQPVWQVCQQGGLADVVFAAFEE